MTYLTASELIALSDALTEWRMTLARAGVLPCWELPCALVRHRAVVRETERALLGQVVS